MTKRNSEKFGRMIGVALLIIIVSCASYHCKGSMFAPHRSDSQSSSTPPSVSASVTALGAPSLLAPASGAVLDNGRIDGKDKIVWDFSWSAVEGAVRYHIWVMHTGSVYPSIDDEPYSTSRHFELTAWIADSNRFDWRWKVRAVFRNPRGGEIVYGSWSEERSFDIEPVDTDPPSD